MKPKRKSENISPPVDNKGPKRQQKMSSNKQSLSSQSSQSQSQPVLQNAQNMQQTPQTPQFFYPNVIQGQQYMSPPLYNQLLNMNPSTGAPVQLSQSQSQQSDILQSVLDRLEKIDSKLGHLSKIESKVDAINQRLNSMDYKIAEIEKSQNFLCEQYDSINLITNSNKVSVENLKEDVSKLAAENVALRQKNESLADDVIDMKCRSMKDNLLFFGIPEGTSQIPGRRFVPSSSGSVPGEDNPNITVFYSSSSMEVSWQTECH